LKERRGRTASSFSLHSFFFSGAVIGSLFQRL
jgi:hypothetical protein